MGEVGSIPFLGMLHDMFPASQFVVTGVLGPGSNAHGPNEFLDITYCKKVVTCVASILAAHSSRPCQGGTCQSADAIGSANARVLGAAEDKLIQQKAARLDLST